MSHFQFSDNYGTKSSQCYKLKHYSRQNHAISGTKVVLPRLSSIITWLGNYFEDICNKYETNMKV
jgi:hypothetical protein